MKYPARLLIIMCFTSIVSSLCIGGFSYWFQKQHILTEAKTRSNLVLDCINASSTFFEHSQKPLVNELLQDNSRFYPELTNGFMVLREFADLFQKNNSDHSFHLATINPLNENNSADHEEARIIEQFRANPQMKKQDGLIKKNGEILYYASSPIKVTDNGCLTCHGKPENAPRAQVILYGMDNGYNWQVNDTISAAIVYVSLKQTIHEAKNSAVKMFFISFTFFILTFLVIILFFERG